VSTTVKSESSRNKLTLSERKNRLNKQKEPEKKKPIRTPRSTVSKSKGITSSASVSSASSVTSSSSTPPPPKGGAVAAEETAEGAPKAEEEASKQQQQQQSPSSIASRKSHIADRLNSIMNNSEKWKTTIGKQNDSHQFTVKSKIAKRNTQHMNGDGPAQLPISVSPMVRRRELKLPNKKTAVITADDVSGSHSNNSLASLSFVSKLAKKGLEDNFIKKSEGQVKEIPQMNDVDFELFFTLSDDVVSVQQPAPTVVPSISIQQHDDGKDDSLDDSLDDGADDSLVDDDDDVECSSLSSHSSDDVTITVTAVNSSTTLTNCMSNLSLQEKAVVQNNNGFAESIDDLVIDKDYNMENMKQRRLLVAKHRNSIRRTQRNPVKQLANRTDLQQSYIEQRSNITTLEQQRIAHLRGGSSFTSAALAGLAHKADLSKVQLRSSKEPAAFQSKSDLKPWKSIMLLRVKGRRHVQTRLVEPSYKSLNSGDAYLLILTDRIFVWFGQYANVIEKAKAQEIADYVIHKNDLGCKAKSFKVVNEGQRCEEFWKLIGGRGSYEQSGGDADDEAFEVSAESTIKTYLLEGSNLVPFTEAWGKLPTMEQLKSDKTFVFDFGAEMYIWQGKEVSFEQRQLAVQLSRKLWSNGYDYTDTKFCPFLPNNKACVELQGKRPEWGLFARVNENLETSLIQEKFEDWSNISRELGKEVLQQTSRGEIVEKANKPVVKKVEMKAYDVARMTSSKSRHRPITLEGYDLWHGKSDIFDSDGRGLVVKTSRGKTEEDENLKVWFANGKEMEEETNNEKLHVFFKNETYVVRWRYTIGSTGKFSAKHAEHDSDVTHLNSDVMRQRRAGNHGDVGRIRKSYFIWRGNGSSVNEKGTAALLTSQLEKDDSPQVIVNDGMEPPLFSSLFEGNLIITDGKRGSRNGFYEWKMFAVCGSDTQHGYLYQVPCKPSSFRSTSTFVIINVRFGGAVIWKGCKSPQYKCDIAAHIVEQIKSTRLKFLGFRPRTKEISVEIIEEGDEKSSDKFQDAIFRMRRNKYRSLMEGSGDDVTTRAWHMTLHPSSGEFVANPLDVIYDVTTDGESELVASQQAPYSHRQLSELPKPALVMLSNMDGVFLWESPPAEEQEGSAKSQFETIKRCAIETTLQFAKQERSSDIEALHVYEDNEPLEFVNSFLVWNEKPEDEEENIKDRRKKKEKSPNEKDPKPLQLPTQ